MSVTHPAQVSFVPASGPTKTLADELDLLATFTPSGTGAVARTISDKLAETLSVKDFGVLGDGVTDDTAALVAAKTAAGTSKTLVINVKARLAGAVGAISSPLRFEGNGALDLTAGGSVTLTGPITAPVAQIFYTLPLARPVNAAHTLGAGTLATATYWYRVSALNAQGETFPSQETSLAITGPAGVNVNWTAVTGATGYKVYGRTAGGELLLATVGAVTTWLDDGSVTPSGALATTDTTTGLTFSSKVPEVLPAWWGAKSNATADDTAAVQSALWAAQNGTVRLTGVHRITSVLIPPQNVRVIGRGPLFSGGLFCDGCAAFKIHGQNQNGGFAFRVYLEDFTIQFTNTPSSTIIIEINTAYSILLDRVRIDSMPDNSSTGVSVINSNDVNLNKLLVYGLVGTTNTGIFVQGIGTTACTVRAIEPDLELLKWGARVFGGGRLDLVTPYMERFQIGIDNQTATGRVLVLGGEILGINSGTFCMEAIAGSHSIVLGTRLDPGSGSHTLFATASGAIIFWLHDTLGTIFSGTSNASGDITNALLGFMPPVTTFANLGTPPNGAVVFCSDATSPSSPATGSGTGALCVRQNGAWKAL